jgi:hypothetical protein
MKNTFKSDRFIIQTNVSKNWEYSDANEEELIWMHEIDECGGFTFGLKDLPFIINTLSEIKDYFDNMPVPKKNDRVKFIKGRMLCLEGTIFDIDSCDKEKPLVIKIDESREMSECTYFCGYDDVEVVK